MQRHSIRIDNSSRLGRFQRGKNAGRTNRPIRIRNYFAAGSALAVQHFHLMLLIARARNRRSRNRLFDTRLVFGR